MNRFRAPSTSISESFCSNQPEPAPRVTEQQVDHSIDYLFSSTDWPHLEQLKKVFKTTGRSASKRPAAHRLHNIEPSVAEFLHKKARRDRLLATRKEEASHVYVGNVCPQIDDMTLAYSFFKLPPMVREADIEGLFQGCGLITTISIRRTSHCTQDLDPKNKENNGEFYACVTFTDRLGCRKAIMRNGKLLMGSQVVVCDIRLLYVNSAPTEEIRLLGLPCSDGPP